jgi:hypothetical protein
MGGASSVERHLGVTGGEHAFWRDSLGGWRGIIGSSQAVIRSWGVGWLKLQDQGFLSLSTSGAWPGACGPSARGNPSGPFPKIFSESPGHPRKVPIPDGKR